MTDTPCIRQPGTVWPACKCDPCRTETNRLAKLYRCGKITTTRRDTAWARLSKWHHTGYSAGLVASMTGIGERGLHAIWKALNEDRTVRIYNRTVEAVLAADEPVDGAGLMLATGASRRLRALAVNGWSLDELKARCGESAIEKVRGGTVHRTHPSVVAKVRDLYDELWDVPGPSNLTRKRALAQGWAPAAAWDDDSIDDPDAVPDLGAEVTRPHGGTGIPVDVLVENITWLLRHDGALTAGELAARFGYADRSAIQNALSRHGHRDLLERLNRNQERAA